MIEVLKHVRTKLSDDPALINSDKRLQLKIWEDEGLVLSAKQKHLFIYYTTPASSIDRARRLVQPDFLSALNPKVASRRAVKFQEIQAQVSPKLNVLPGKKRGFKQIFKLKKIEHHA